MKKVNAMEMRNIEGGAWYYTYYRGSTCTVMVICADCQRAHIESSRIWFGYKAGAKYQATNKVNNWLYNHGCWRP